MLYLLVRDGGAEREVVLREGTLTVGRLSSSDIVLSADDVSREHAQVRVSGGVVEVSDLEASNRTALRQARASRGSEPVPLRPREWQRIHPGDVITLGSRCGLELRESLSAIAAVAAAPPSAPVAEGRIETLVPETDAGRLLQAVSTLAQATREPAAMEQALGEFVRNAPGVRAGLIATGGAPSPRMVAWVTDRADGKEGPSPLPLALAQEALALPAHDARWTEGSEERPAYLACRAPGSLALVLELSNTHVAPAAELVVAARLAAALLAGGASSIPTDRREDEAARIETRPPATVSNLFPGVVPSQAFRSLLEQAARVAAGIGPILVVGETGVGKELIARFLHAASGRKGAFVEASVGALSPALVESELFGHVRGSFTDATRDRVGLIEQAHEGTLFLDEIGEVPLEVQHKLLRALQERTFRRVGSNETMAFDALIVAATNRDLESEVRAGRFREDLFYRLNMMEVRVPPLRERPGDIAVIAQSMLHELDPRRTLDVQALDWLVRQPWSGNVRQLRNVLARAVRLHDASILRPEHLGASADDKAKVHVNGAPLDWREAQEAFEAAWCQMLWTASEGRMSDASRLSGLDRSNVRKRLARHGFGTDADAEGGEG